MRCRGTGGGGRGLLVVVGEVVVKRRDRQTSKT